MYFGNVGTSAAPTYAARSLAAQAVLARGADWVRIELGENDAITLEDNGRPLLLTDFEEPKRPLPRCQPRLVDLFMITSAAQQLHATARGLYVQAHSGELKGAREAREQERNHITLHLDPGLFNGVTAVEPFSLRGWLRDFAALHPGVAITVAHHQLGESTYLYPSGLAQRIAEETAGRTLPPIEPVQFAAYSPQWELDLAFISLYGDAIQCLSFLNQERTLAGGAHVDGAIRALRQILAEGDCQHGFYLAIAIRTPNPEWAGCIREKTLGSDLEGYVYQQLWYHAAQIQEAIRHR